MTVTISEHNRTVEVSNVSRVTIWDREVKGYAGVAQYTHDGGRYMSNVTRNEARALKSAGVTCETIKAISYRGTY